MVRTTTESSDAPAMDRWDGRLSELAPGARDGEAIAASTALRELLLDLARAPSASAPAHKDLFDACARLGRLLAEHGASPTLASNVLGVADDLFGDGAPLAAMGAAFFEGYAAATRDATQRACATAWEYPQCAVRVNGNTVAIAGGYPEVDREALGDWAARVAHALTRAGIRRALIGGPERAQLELREALELVGIEVVTEQPITDGPSTKRRSLWPWKPRRT